MVQYIKATLCLLAVTTTVRTQYFDFITALQPFIQYPTTRSPLYADFTTKKTKSHRATTRRAHVDNDSVSFYYDVKNEKRVKTTNPAIVFQDDTTQRSIRKTTKTPSHRNSNVHTTKSPPFQRDIDVSSLRDPKPKDSQNSKSNIDNISYEDGKINTVFNYETTRPNFYTTKSVDDHRRKTYQTTHNPLINRPGVKPAVTHGVPITNRPATVRPSFGPRPDSSSAVTPELIIGPNDDFMSSADKRRYIELAEKMCDKYKATNVRQLEAIPLLPSPDPVRVNVSTCVPSNIPLVVGGKVVDIHEFPHMALLGWKKTQGEGYSWKCGGSLISPQYILTAAHCAYQDRDNSVATGPPSLVQLASSYLNDPNGKIVRVAAVIRHPKYKLPKSYYDISIVKMANTVTFSDVIKPACLGVPPPPGDPIIATGWGRTEFVDQSQELRSVSIPVWDMSECYEVLGTSRKLPDGPSRDSQICAGERRGGKDTCQGDSGGPAQIQDGCVWRVVAVTSLGRSCGAPHTPALYATVPLVFVAAVAFGDVNSQKDLSNRGIIDQGKGQNYQPTNDYDNNQRNENRRNQNTNIENNYYDKKHSEENHQSTNTYDYNHQTNIRNNQDHNNYNTNIGNNNDKRQSESNYQTSIAYDYNHQGNGNINQQNNGYNTNRENTNNHNRPGNNNQQTYDSYNTNSNTRQETNINNFEMKRIDEQKRNQQIDQNNRQTHNYNQYTTSTTVRYDTYNQNNNRDTNYNRNDYNNNNNRNNYDYYPQNIGYNGDINYGDYNRQSSRSDLSVFNNNDRAWWI